MEPNPNQQHADPTRARWIKVVPAAITLVVFIAAASADYEVQSGDTLNQIAAELGVSKAELIAVNGISNPDLIRVGQVLWYPAKPPPHRRQPTSSPPGKLWRASPEVRHQCRLPGVCQRTDQPEPDQDRPADSGGGCSGDTAGDDRAWHRAQPTPSGPAKPSHRSQPSTARPSRSSPRRTASPTPR